MKKLKANTQLTTTKKSRKRHHSRRQVRDAQGRFVPVQKPTPEVDWQQVHAWKVAWQQHRQAVQVAKHERRWGGLRVITTFALLSGALVGLLVVGTLAQAG
jgi:hypothetical protein